MGTAGGHGAGPSIKDSGRLFKVFFRRREREGFWRGFCRQPKFKSAAEVQGNDSDDQVIIGQTKTDAGEKNRGSEGAQEVDGEE